ncbi:MAG: glycosyltransferase [Thermoleophilia bacterium]|nr:glycosyltransferase [Thermoleophilia bacterium]
MRVLHMHFGREGGAERFFVNLVAALADRGVEQRFVIRPDRSWLTEISPFGPVIQNNFRRLEIGGNLLHLRVRWLIHRWNPDAIMAWMPRAARLMPAGAPAVKIARMGDFPRHLKHFAACDVLVGNIPGIAERCRSLGWTRPAVTISNFPRAVTPVPVARAHLGTPAGVFLVAAGGRFVPRKGFDTALRAIAMLPDAWLWLVGDGEERAALEALARDLGVADRVRFTGWVREPVHHIAAADAFVLPSRHEPLGNVLLEAWAAGTPSVSTRAEGPDWFMRDGTDGLMVPIDDPAAMAAALARLRDDPAAARGYAANARTRLAAMFSEEAVAEAYLRLFSGNLTDPARLDAQRTGD